MSYGTTLEYEIFFSHENLTDYQDVLNAIEESKDDISDLKERILMYCASGIKGVCSDDCEGNPMNPVDALHSEITHLLERYEEAVIRHSNLLALKEDWDDNEKKFKTAWYG